MTKIRKLCLTILVLPLVLGGCGGGGGSGGDSTPPPVETPTDPGMMPEDVSDTIANVISDAITKNAATRFQANAKVVDLNFATGRASFAPDETVAVTAYRPSPDEAPTVIVDALGREIVFSASDEDEESGGYFYYKEDGNSFFQLGTSPNTWLEAADGEGSYHYLIPVDAFYYFSDTDSSKAWYGVIGLETEPGNVQEVGSATFTGESFIDVNVVDAELRSIVPRFVQTDLMLNVDFGTETISGKLYEFAIWNRESREYHVLPVNPGLVLNILETGIDGNGFSSAMAFDPSSCTDTPCTVDLTAVSTIEGRFFGDAAQEAGGTLQFDQFILPSLDVTGTAAGVWAARQQEHE